MASTHDRHVGQAPNEVGDQRDSASGGPSRREVLRAGGIAAAVAFASGCDLLSTDPGRARGRRGGAASLKDKESPELAKLVKAGKLPPLEKRLPADPMVVQPHERL